MTKIPFSLRFILLFLPILLLGSCSLFEPPADIPSYIHIDSIGLTTSSKEGSNSHKIKDAWVYVDGKIQGVYQLPCTFPVLATGSHQIDVKAGIFINGISSTRGSYPFYQFYSTTANLSPQTTTTIKPVVSYYSGSNFIWLEDFDGTGMSMQIAPGSTDSIRKDSINGFEKQYAYAIMNTTTPYFECESIYNFALPTNGNSVYLEMNYKGTNTIRVGVIPHMSGVIMGEDTVLEVRPSSTWNKIYVDLTSVCASYPNAYGFNIFIAAYLEDGLTSSEIYFDNLKLIYQ